MEKVQTRKKAENQTHRNRAKEDKTSKNKNKKTKSKQNALLMPPHLQRKLLIHLVKLTDGYKPLVISKSATGKTAIISLDDQDPEVQELIAAKVRASWIPFLHSLFRKGTQIPAFRLYSTDTTINFVTTVSYTTVLQINMSLFLNFSSLAVVFDEYRIISGEVEYRGNRYYMDPTGSLMGIAAAVIDYDDTTALATFDGALQYDTRKIFAVTSHSFRDYPVRWPLMFDPLPDQDWITTATNNQTFATWKPYFPITYVDGSASLGALGSVQAWVDVQFRNMD